MTEEFLSASQTFVFPILPQDPKGLPGVLLKNSWFLQLPAKSVAMEKPRFFLVDIQWNHLEL